MQISKYTVGRDQELAVPVGSSGFRVRIKPNGEILVSLSPFKDGGGQLIPGKQNYRVIYAGEEFEFYCDGFERTFYFYLPNGTFSPDNVVIDFVADLPR